jgi:predicted transcriptional regulator of viral defense system
MARATPLDIVNGFEKSGPFTSTEAQKVGLSRSALYRLVKEGRLKKLARGLFLHPKSKINYETLDFAIAQALFGSKAVIGGLTALFEYRLIEQVPQRIWVLVPPSIRSRHKRYRLIRTQTSYEIGIDDHGTYKMTNIDRTLIEALHYSTKIGLGTAYKAIRTALAEKKTTHAKLARVAKNLGMYNVIVRHWEAIES